MAYTSFEDADNGNARTVTTEAHIINMLDNVMSVNTDSDIWYQQIVFLVAMEWLKNRFGKNIIYHRPDFPWAARSPDLPPLHFLLSRDKSKKRIFRPNMTPLNSLKKLSESYCIPPSKCFSWCYSDFSKKSKSLCSATGWPFRTFILEYYSLNKTWNCILSYGFYFTFLRQLLFEL